MYLTTGPHSPIRVSRGPYWTLLPDPSLHLSAPGQVSGRHHSDQAPPLRGGRVEDLGVWASSVRTAALWQKGLAFRVQRFGFRGKMDDRGRLLSRFCNIL